MNKIVHPAVALRQIRCLSLTQAVGLNQKWRKERGLPLNPNSHGVLTDGADYSFLDGRPTPYGIHQHRRILNQKELARQIIELSGEIDFAVDRHKRMQEDEEYRRQQILEAKLTPKGIEMLKQKKRLNDAKQKGNPEGNPDGH